MAKKKKTEDEVTAGGRRICPDCKLQFKLKQLFDQHRAAGCKPVKDNGPTWSDIDPEAVNDQVNEAAQE